MGHNEHNSKEKFYSLSAWYSEVQISTVMLHITFLEKQEFKWKLVYEKKL